MKISIFGLGYVGCVSAACLAEQGHTVVGVDVIEEKVNLVNGRQWPIYEPGLDKLIERAGKRISATLDAETAVRQTSCSLLCVGTPSRGDGTVDLSYLTNTVNRIARAIRKARKKKHILLVRSTVPPGTVEKIVLPKTKRLAGVSVIYLPEFLREGSAVKDFFDPGLNVAGITPGMTSSRLIRFLKQLNPQVKTPVEIVDVRTAESIKYANNTFHALKIVFANELALICKEYGADSDQLMNLFCKDTKLNLSPYYLTPGFAYGGSCLPKEIVATIGLARQAGIDPVLFEAIDKSNEELIARLVKLIYSLDPETVGYLGITFKPNTDDLRESPVLKAVDAIHSKTRSYSRSIRQVLYDRKSALDRLNSRFDSALVRAKSVSDLIEQSDVVVIGPYRITPALEKQLNRSGKHVINLKWYRPGKALSAYRHYHTLV